jgi:hypothetical protein
MPSHSYKISMNFELFMQFQQDDHTYILCGMNSPLNQIIYSHKMGKLLKKCSRGVIAHFYGIFTEGNSDIP